MAPVSTELERRLFERIKREGPLLPRLHANRTLRSELGYYNTERLKFGAQGDYYTSSNVHPAFGAVLARAFAELWPAQVSRRRSSRWAPAQGSLPLMFSRQCVMSIRQPSTV